MSEEETLRRLIDGLTEDDLRAAMEDLAVNGTTGVFVSAEGARRVSAQELAGVEIYGDWTIRFDPPPIPIRTMDWTYSHKDYDGENQLYGYAGSVEECKADIDEIEAERTP